MTQSVADVPLFVVGHRDRDPGVLQRLLCEAAIGDWLDGIATAPPETTLLEVHEPAGG